MKNITEIKREKLKINGFNSVENGDSDRLLNCQEGGQTSLKCLNGRDRLINCDNSCTNGVSMGHKSRLCQRNLIKNQESRSLSLPDSSDNSSIQKNGYVQNENKLKTFSKENICKLECENDNDNCLHLESPKSEFWFKTWPERNKNCDNSSYEINSNSNGTSTHDPGSEDSSKKSKSKTFTLNEALQSISLAYSPITKQLHLLENRNDINKLSIDSNNSSDLDIAPNGESANLSNGEKVKLGHRRTEAGSFSSTVSSLSDPSPSGSLLDPEDRTFLQEDLDGAGGCKRRGFTSFFNRNVFQWGSNSSQSVLDGASGWRLFGKRHTDQVGDVQNSSSPKRENLVASSTALIQHERPANLPAKDLDEEQRHREEYKAMVLAAKKREAKNSAAKQRQQRLQLQAEEQLAAATKFWNTQVLPKWDNMYKTKKTRDNWWQGLPSSVRGKIWRLAIGNDLNLTQPLYEICLARAQTRLKKNNSDTDVNSESTHSDFSQESSMDLIKLDIARTFPNLCIFQEGGPYSEILHTLLAAYVSYRPDVGYVQGMSFVAAVLILNMEQYEAFVCFANLLNRPLHLAAFTLNQKQMQAYYSAYNEIFEYNLPKLCSHFENSGLTPDLYLLDWIYTVFAKAMPLDVACRVWDVFLRDGEEFIFRTALGVLHLHQDLLIKMDFIHGAQLLTKLPEDLSADSLFKSIQSIYVNIGKITFNQIVDKYKDS